MSTVEWKPAKLDELGFVGRGKSRHRPRNAGFLYGGRYPFFQTGDIKAANFHLTEYSQTYNEEGLAQSKLWKPGTLCITIAANIAESAILGIEGCFPDSVVGFVADPEKADVRFIKYYMEILKLQMQSVSRGTTQDNLSVDKLLSFDFRVPPLPVQRRIADILSAYDELMENCQRRIRILEEMARALYREWFVHFRFPGHEKVPRVTSELGPIPRGWEVKTIADACESITYGYTASATRDEVGPKFLRITDIVPATVDWAGVPFCEIPKDKAPKYLLKDGDIVVARTGATTGYAKRLNKLHPATVFASYLVRARAKVGVSNRMLGILMESDEYKQFIQTNIGGAAQPQANAVVLTSMQVAVPPASIGEGFDQLVAPMIDESELLAAKIQNLRRTRNLLLPRLMSGLISLDISASGPKDLTPHLFRSELPSEEPLLHAAEEAPPYRIERAENSILPPTGLAETAGFEDETPSVPIEQTGRTEVLQTIRQVFSEGPPRERDVAIREVARALGYRRTGARIQEILRTDLLTAVRRGILENTGDELRLLARSITDYERDFLKQQFLAAIGRAWIDRDTAIRDFCRWLGFARTGPLIEETGRSLINGLLREGRLEADGSELIRRSA